MKRSPIMTGLYFGLLLGVSLFIVEALFIIVSGKRIPLSYLSLTFLIDGTGGVVAGSLAGFLSALAKGFFPREEDREFDLLASLLLFFLLSFLGFFFLHGRILMGTKFYEWKGLLATFILVILGVLFAMLFYFLCPLVRGKFFRVYPTGFAELLLLEILASGYLWLNEYKLVSPRGHGRLLVNAILLSLLFLVYLSFYFFVSKLASKFLGKSDEPLCRRALRFSRNATILLFLGLSLLWAFTSLDGDMLRPSRKEQKAQNINTGPPERAVPVNIILISVDTLRASNLSCYGYSRETSPHIDRFAKDALLFTNAVSSSSWTLPAHASLFTGLVPYRHGAHYADKAPSRDDPYPVDDLDMTGVHPLPASAVTLAELLKELGYTNAAFVSNFAALPKSLGMAQGFDLYEDRERAWVTFQPLFHRITKTVFKDYGLVSDFINRTIKPFRSAKAISDEAIRWLKKKREGPFFLFLNYMEPHRPYLPYPPFDRKFLGERVLAMTDPFFDVMGKVRPLREREKDYLLSQYDGEIAYADLHIGRLFQVLKEMGLYESSLIILLSDHGEMFGEHDMLDHTNSLYEEVLRIALLVKDPHSKRSGIENARVGIIDVLPGILEFLREKIPDDLDGSPFERGSRNPLAELYINRYYFKEFGERFGHLLRAKYEGPYKLIASSSGDHELYHLTEDPGESRNLAQEYPEMRDRILKQVEQFIMEKKPARGQEGVDQETREKLRSLGYLE